jgi:hypothetical protein
VTAPEPERVLIRRITPFAVPAAVVAYACGALIAGAAAGWSAAVAIAIVYVNFVVNALSIAWAASISPTLVSIVALGGYVMRLIVFTLALVLLNQLEWFSPVAFALALVPSVIALLVSEARLLSGRMQAELWTFDGAGRP